MTSGTIPIGMRAVGIWSREARGRVVRHDQIRDGVKVAERGHSVSKGMSGRQRCPD